MQPEKCIVRPCHPADIAACTQALGDTVALGVSVTDPDVVIQRRTVSSVVKCLLLFFVRFLIIFLTLRFDGFFVNMFCMRVFGQTCL